MLTFGLFDAQHRDDRFGHYYGEKVNRKFVLLFP